MMQKHWVEELFPPFYTYTLDTPATSTSEHNPARTPDDDGKNSKRIQEMYDRVRIDLNQVELERHQKCIQVGVPLAEHLPEKSPADGSSPERRSRKKTPSKRKDDCIWTAEELDILRQATEEAKQENTRLKAELTIVVKQKEKLGRKYKRQSIVLTTKESELLEKKKEIERLSLCCRHLETESEHCRMITRLQEEDIFELKESKRQLKKELTILRQELSVEKLAQVKLSRELQQVGKKNALGRIIREDGIRLDYERQIKSLYEELQEARIELEKERRENTSARKALDHLRIHFASLPSKRSSEPQPGGNNELGQLHMY